MKYQLVLQWSGSSLADYDSVVAMADDLELALGEAADVDGWDFGSGLMNIFIYTDDPQSVLVQAKATLEAHGRWPGVRSGYRDVDGDDFTVLWPKELSAFDVA